MFCAEGEAEGAVVIVGDLQCRMYGIKGNKSILYGRSKGSNLGDGFATSCKEVAYCSDKVYATVEQTATGILRRLAPDK